MHEGFNYRGGHTEVNRACQFGTLEDVEKSLEGLGADFLNEVMWNGDTPLILACKRGDPSIVKLLLEKGAITEPNKYWGHPLASACLYNHTSVIELLLNSGADVHAASLYDGQTSLMVASRHGSTDAMQLILEAGAEINHASHQGVTALFLACWANNVESVRLLLNAGAKIDQANNDGATPLWMACRDGRDDIVELLLSEGANPNANVSADSEYFPGTSPLDIANQGGHHNIVEKLIQSGANCPPDEGHWRAAASLIIDKIVAMLLNAWRWCCVQLSNAWSWLCAVFSSQSNEASSQLISSDSIEPKSSSWFDISGVLSFSFFECSQDPRLLEESEVDLNDHKKTN